MSVCRDGRPCKGGLARRFGLGKIFQVETLEPDTGSRRRKGRPRRRRSSRRRSTGTDLRVRVVWLAVSDFEKFSKSRLERARAKPEPSVAGLGRWVRRKARDEAIAGVSVCRDCRPCKGGFGLGKIFQVETPEPDAGSRRRKGRPRRRRSSRRRSTGTDLRVYTGSLARAGPPKALFPATVYRDGPRRILGMAGEGWLAEGAFPGDGLQGRPSL